MANATINWTNNSQNVNPLPTATSIERVEQLDFNHASATVVPLVNDNSSGLDPSLINGSYTDNNIVSDKNYTYRIKTMRGDEFAESFQTNHNYIHDIADDLGYPNGAPATALNYNVTTEPDIHLDCARIPKYDFNASGGEMAFQGFDDILRHNNTNIALNINPSEASASPVLIGTSYNGKIRRSLQQPINQTRNIQVRANNANEEYTSPDGMTVFIAIYVSNNSTVIHSKALGGNVTNDITVNNINYNANHISVAGSTITGGFLGVQSSGSVSRSTPGVHIYCFRLNNTLAQYNTGTIMGQIFESGTHITNSPNLLQKSYHATNGTFPNNAGAYHLNSSSGEITFMLTNYHKHSLYEYIMFPSALTVEDMNEVYGYLGNKYNNTINVLNTTDLIG